MKKGYAIIDLQFGSTGKGLLAGYLAARNKPDGVVCAFGPNAGHTYIDAHGRKFVHVMLPMGFMTANYVLFGPGSVVHPGILEDEILHARDCGFYNFQVAIHENAAVVCERHREAEATGNVIGSTAKGMGAALIEKISRRGSNVARIELRDTALEGMVVSVPAYNDIVDSIDLMQIEGAQGHSLSVHHGFWPYTTSRDCSIWQLMADCGLPWRNGVALKPVSVYGTCRTYPIRVNNRGHSSGPGYPDQTEIGWSDIGLQPELTTVTRLPRRLFTFSEQQIREAIRLNGVDGVFLNFANYDKNGGLVSMIEDVIKRAGSRVRWMGYGPTDRDVRAVV